MGDVLFFIFFFWFFMKNFLWVYDEFGIILRKVCFVNWYVNIILFEKISVVEFIIEWFNVIIIGFLNVLLVSGWRFIDMMVEVIKGWFVIWLVCLLWFKYIE